MIELNLVRHGETEENVAQIMQGHLPGHLTTRGKTQVAALREQLVQSGKSFDVLLASDLQRTLDTAAILNEAFQLPSFPVPYCANAIGAVLQASRSPRPRLSRETSLPTPKVFGHSTSVPPNFSATSSNTTTTSECLP